MKHLNTTLLALSLALALPVTGLGATKICLVLPKAQLGQGSSGADHAWSIGS